MSVPTHRAGCKTRIFKTSCHDCGKPVWFFACSCGSRVFFDDKGPPWPLHAEKCPNYHIRLLIEDGNQPSAVRRLLEAEARVRKSNIPDEVLGFIAVYEKSIENKKAIVKEVLPTEDPFKIAGLITKMDPINIYKRFGFTENPISKAVLGVLVLEPQYEIVVREEQTSDSVFIQECSFFVSQKIANALKLRVKQKIQATLILKDFVGDDDQAVWIAKEINRF